MDLCLNAFSSSFTLCMFIFTSTTLSDIMGVTLDMSLNGIIHLLYFNLTLLYFLSQISWVVSEGECIPQP